MRGSLRNCVGVSLRSVRVGGCSWKWTPLPTWSSKLVWPYSQTLSRKRFLMGLDHLGRTMGRGSFLMLTEPLGKRQGGFLVRCKAMNKAALGGSDQRMLPSKTSRRRWLEVRPHGGVGKTGRTKGRRRGRKRLGSWRRGEQMLPTRPHCWISCWRELVWR